MMANAIITATTTPTTGIMIIAVLLLLSLEVSVTFVVGEEIVAVVA